MNKKIYFIEGDGIGKEIWQAAKPVIEQAIKSESDITLDWHELLAGEKAVKECGNPLPIETLNCLKDADIAIKGPLGTPVGTGMRSLNVALRQGLDLYACIRPIKHFKGLSTPVVHPEKIDMVIFRENTEDVYAGVEFAAKSPEANNLLEYLKESLNVKNIANDSALGIKPMCEKNSKRLVRKAIQYALDNNRKSVTLVHKGNIMKFTEGAFRQWGYDVANEEFANKICLEKEIIENRLIIKDRIADAMFQEALLHPEQYDILATPNLNGDYISDALAAQVGGLGVSPGVNMSDKLAFFEATHGTAPNIAGKDKANPTSLILCGALLCEHLKLYKASNKIYQAIEKAIEKKKITEDLANQVKGSTIVSCKEFGEIIGENL